MIDEAATSGSTADAPVPDHLLLPVVEAAGDTLRSLEPAEVPLALRHLHGFDRRGLLHGPAPRQIRQALDRDDAFRGQVLERFLARPEVVTMIDDWDAGAAFERAADASARGDLALLASALWAGRPAGWSYGLGVIVTVETSRKRNDEAADAARADARDRAALEEARRRAEAARMESEIELERVREELREERRSRVERQRAIEADAAAATQQVEVLRADVAREEAATRDAEARGSREAQRARALEEELQRLRAQTAATLGSRADDAASRLSPADAHALRQSAHAARSAASAVDALVERLAPKGGRLPPGTSPGLDVGSEGPAPAVGAPTRRVTPDSPPGILTDSAAGADAMLRTRGVVLVVDGYNVSKREWPDAPASDQRERLVMALDRLHLRRGCETTLVFDGDGTTGAPVLRRRGLRVLFSAAGEEADEVVVREVAALPKRVPVVVASSDRWVQEHAQAQGAVVISADTLLAVLH